MSADICIEMSIEGLYTNAGRRIYTSICADAEIKFLGGRQSQMNTDGCPQTESITDIADMQSEMKRRLSKNLCESFLLFIDIGRA